MRSPRTMLLVVALAMPWACQAAESPHAPARAVNVLMIAVDDLRPDLGCYGSSFAKSRSIDRLAARGTTFHRAYCQQAVCSPSRTALLTGLRPDTTRVWDLQTHFRKAVPGCVTLPQHFKSCGYHTAALGKIYHAGHEDGASWSEPHWYATGRTVDTDPADWSRRITVRFPGGVKEYPEDEVRNERGKGRPFVVSDKADDELPDGATAAEAVRRLAKLGRTGQPFFLAVGFQKPHLPFVAPRAYWDLHDPDSFPPPSIASLPTGAPAFAGHDNGELHAYAGVPPGNPVPDALARRLRHGYHACVSYMDAQVGRVLEALEHEGLADRTVVVLWGDHGWQLGDHGLWHKHTNFERATHAPLIIAVPEPTHPGGSCRAVVEFVDVYPTLVDICGLPAVTGLAGVSLCPLLDDPSGGVKEVAISQYPRRAGNGTDVPLMGYSIRDDRWRLTVWREDGTTRVVATELYDESNDPGETRNLAADAAYRPVIDRLSRHLPAAGPGASASPPGEGGTPRAGVDPDAA